MIPWSGKTDGYSPVMRQISELNLLNSNIRDLFFRQEVYKVFFGCSRGFLHVHINTPKSLTEVSNTILRALGFGHRDQIRPHWRPTESASQLGRITLLN